MWRCEYNSFGFITELQLHLQCGMGALAFIKHGTDSPRLANTMTGGYALADHLTPPPLVGRQVSVDSTTTHADDDASAAITHHHTSEPGA